MNRYPSYKPSGVKWLGEIPSHWEAIALKRVFIRRVAGSWGEDENRLPKNSVCLRIADFEYGKLSFKTKEEYTVRSYFEDEVKNKHLIKGDILIEKSGGGEKTPVGRCVMYDLDIEKPMYANFMEKLVCQSMANPKFINYLMSSLYTRGVIWPYIKATTGIQNLDITSLLQKETVYLPPFEEQFAIASYLDTATAKIDAAIAQQQKMIDLLNERKQIIINRAVTKGLNPDAKMKDSGVEWIGEVPEHWEVRRLGSLGAFSKGGNISRDDLQEYGKCAILYGDIYTKYNIQTSIVRNHISEKVAEKSVRITKGDLIMTGSGETKEDIGKTIVYHGDEAFIGGDVILFRQQNNDSTFLSYALNSQYAKDFRYKESKGEIIVHIYASSLKRLFLALPPIEEQIKVVKYLDGQIDAIDSEIDVINKQISLLQERKQIIINEVVTGRVRVI